MCPPAAIDAVDTAVTPQQMGYYFDSAASWYRIDFFTVAQTHKHQQQRQQKQQQRAEKQE